MKKTTPVHHTIREQLTGLIRKELIAGEFEEGEQLKEKQLSERFGVSRGPIRDAILELTKEGLLVTRQHRGAVVGRRPSPVIRPLVVDIRRKIESFALNKIFNRIDRDDLAFFEHNLEEFYRFCKHAKISSMVEHDMAFHRYIVEKVDEPGLVAIWLPVVTNMMLPYSRHKDLMESYEEHIAIFEAIKSGNKKAAIRNLKANIQ